MALVQWLLWPFRLQMPVHILNKRQKLINCVSPLQKFPNFLTLHFRASSQVLLVEEAVALSKAVWKEQVTLISILVSYSRQTKLRETLFLPAAELLMKLLSLHLATPVLPSSTGHCNSFLQWQGLETRERHKPETLCKLDLPFRFLFVFGMSQQMLV